MAVTAVVTSTKIDITSTGGVWETFDAVVTAVNAVTPGTITGSGTSADPYVITITAGTRELEISSGCMVRFAANTVVRWGTFTTGGTYAIDFASGSRIEILDGCDIDSSGGTVTIYWAWYGDINVKGTSGNRVTLGGYSRIYFYFNTIPLVDDPVLEYFDIVNLRSSPYGFYCSQTSTGRVINVTIREFTMTGPSGGRGIYFTGGGMFSNYTFTNFVIDNFAIGVNMLGISAKIQNGTIQNCTAAGLDCANAGNVISAAYETAQDDTRFPTGRFQSMGVAENVTFIDNDAGVYSVVCDVNSLVLLTGCTFIGNTYSGTQDGIYSNTGAVVLEHDLTFTNIDKDRIWGNDGTHLHAHPFRLRVVDDNGDPVKDASVSWIQGSNPSKERWGAVTQSDGYVKTVFGDDPFFVEKEETATGVYQDWTTDGLKMTVVKHGYKKFEAVYTMTSDKDVVVTLHRDFKKPYIDQEVI